MVEGARRGGEVVRSSIARHVGVAQPVHSDGPAVVRTATTQESGVDQPTASRIELRCEGVPIAVVARVEGTWRGGKSMDPV